METSRVPHLTARDGQHDAAELPEVARPSEPVDGLGWLAGAPDRRRVGDRGDAGRRQQDQPRDDDRRVEEADTSRAELLTGEDDDEQGDGDAHGLRAHLKIAHEGEALDSLSEVGQDKR